MKVKTNLRIVVAGSLAIKSSLSVLVFIFISLFSFAQYSDTSFTVDKGVIYCEKGIPQAPRWFADSRLAFSFDEHGIAQVDYYDPGNSQNLATIFLRQLWDGFRYFLEKDKKTFKPEYRNSRVWPFGIESEWVFENAVIQHRVMAIDESIVIQVIMPDNIPAGLCLKMEFFEAFGLTKGSRDDIRFAGGSMMRHWNEWKFLSDQNILEGGFDAQSPDQSDKKSPHPFHNMCVISADFSLEHLLSAVNEKHTLRSPLLEAGKTYSFCISFGSVHDALIKKNNLFIQNLKNKIQEQFIRYKKTAEDSPVLESPYAGLNNFISLAPMYHESLKIKDFPGALRAKTSNYWVWGWDGMTSNEATAFWGDVDHIRNMLKFYEVTADSGKGIGHAYDYDMKPASISALPAQGMYISLLQLYYANTGDIHELRERYPFAKKIFNLIAKTEVAKTGFCEGSSLFPDFPSAMNETGNDISSFNNTIFYCAARSMESLAALTGDKQEQKIALDIIRRFEGNFVRRFFNKEKNFIVASIDSKTLQQRDTYTSNSIRWENNYCADLTDSINISSLRFFKDNVVTPMGLREIPLWNKSYDMDANQLHCWWPVTGEYFMRLINTNNQKNLVDQWIRWVDYWTKNLTCPEGISYYLETEEPEFDRWTSQKGTWQAYSMRGWYQAAIHGVVGVGTDEGGLTFYPYSGEEMKLTGLHFMNKIFDIEMKGSGKYIEAIEVNGVTVTGTNKLPSDLYDKEARVRIVVRRAPVNPYIVSISSGTAVALRNYKYTDEKITADLSGAGLCRVKLNVCKMPLVKLNGKKVHVSYSPKLHLATIELNCVPGVLQKIEIK